MILKLQNRIPPRFKLILNLDLEKKSLKLRLMSLTKINRK
jgi:hypothetical protein